MTPAAMARAERAAEIRVLVEIEGRTFTQTADILGLTRSTVAGITARHAIRSPNTPGATKPLSTRLKPRAKAARARQEARERSPEPVQPAVPPEPPSAAWLPLPGSSPVTVEHHREGTCRWPVTFDTRTLFCAEPVLLDPAGVRVYGSCPTHHAMGTKSWPERKPK